MSKEETLKKIANLAEKYTPNRDTLEAISDKTLIMLVGPSAVGKDYCIDQVTKENPRYAKVKILTTRAPREDDHDGDIEFIPNDEESLAKLLEDIENGDLVQLAIHPSGDIYGSRVSSYPAEFNMLPTMYSVAPDLQEIQFKETKVLGVLSSPDDWMERFEARFSESSDRKARLKESTQSLQWLASKSDAYGFIVNAKDCDIVWQIQRISSNSNLGSYYKQIINSMLVAAENQTKKS